VVSRLDKEHAGRAGINVPEVAREGKASELGNCAGHLNARGAAADNHEWSWRRRSTCVGDGLVSLPPSTASPSCSDEQGNWRVSQVGHLLLCRDRHQLYLLMQDHT
jgi:hypothetical protein